MTEAEAMAVPCVAVPVAAASGAAEQQASSLITSCARKQAEKRRADSCHGGQGLQHQQVPVAKRSRAEDDDDDDGSPNDQDPSDQGQGCSTSDVSINDQENLQQVTAYQQLPGTQHTAARAACSTLGHMLAPFVGWMPGPGAGQQQLQQLNGQQLLALQQGQQLLLEQAVGPACAQEDALAWSDEAVACSEEGLNNSPSTSSGPAVSQPSTTAGTSLQSCSQRQAHKQHLPHQQQQEQQQQQQQQDEELQPQQASYSVQGTAVTCAANTAEDSTDDIDYDEDDFCPFTFISSLGPVERYIEPGRQPLLPRQTRACKQKTLVLDLDETLVHSTLDAGYGAGADFSFPVLFNGSEHLVHVRTRPHMQEFLERVAELYEVVVFTASQKVCNEAHRERESVCVGL